MGNKFVLTREAAKILDVPQWGVWRAYQTGKLPAPVEFSPRKFGWSLIHLQKEAARRAQSSGRRATRAR